MRQIVRNNQHYIGFKYPNNRLNITAQLLLEQNNYCAITEEYIRVVDKIDIAHFNPTLKETPQDSCSNWLGVLPKFNKLMGTKNAQKRWENHQPILHPISNDFINRVLYNIDDATFYHQENDDEAKNLISFLNLNNSDLVEERKKYIARRREQIDGGSPQSYFDELIQNEPWNVFFIRAIIETFGINLNL